MSKEYIFEYTGTKEELLGRLNRYHRHSYSDGDFYYFDDYIVKVTEDEIHFGVERGGHSGGYWFIPTITEHDHRLELRGTIRYIGPDDDKHTNAFKKILEWIETVFLFILFLPVILICWIYQFIQWSVRKIRKSPKPKTTEDKLFDLMENYFGCMRK
jgi:hypothetical protein